MSCIRAFIVMCYTFSWERILSDYDVFHGGLLLVGLVVLVLSPLIAARLHQEHNL